jgi:ornithine--oxo-acid transaminase
LSWRVMERMQTGLFAQLVVVPLFRKHHILTQVAGHDLAVLKGLPPLVLSERDIDDFVTALDDVIAKATRPAALAGMALRAARAR